MDKTLRAAIVVLVAAGSPALAQYHSGSNLLCSDCHSSHQSLSHGWDGSQVSTTAQPFGNWLSSTNPVPSLLKMPADQLCGACHDAQNFAPDVVGNDANTSPTQGRSAGALNNPTLGAPYDTWRGHTLTSTVQPPGYEPTLIGAPATWYDATQGLQCTSCHGPHGTAGVYRNLGNKALGGALVNAQPTFVVATTNDTTKDVWIDIASTYTPNTGNASTFDRYYDSANISYNRNDATVGTTKTSNRMDTFCGSCHGAFHGGPGDANIGASPGALTGFTRHPSSETTIGASLAQGYAGHSNLARYVAAATKVKVYANDRVGYADASPGCVSCHKAHGNKNPFGLVFLNRNAASVGEEGGYATGQVESPDGWQVGYRNLCGQCHDLGN